MTDLTAVFLWLVFWELLGLIMLPLSTLLFSRLSDRGAVFGKTLGWLLLGWLVWVILSLQLFTNTRGLIAAALLLLTALNVFVWRKKSGQIKEQIRKNWRTILWSKTLYFLFFFFALGLRAFNPDLWHPIRGGEKLFELALLNGSLWSEFAPPYDFWFAGEKINYYYFGHFLLSLPIKLTGIPIATAFNLAIATLFGLLASHVFTLGSTLARRVSGGVIASLLVCVSGNWAAYLLLREQMAQGFSWANAVLPFWDPSRVIDNGLTINEFPYFSFLFADLHAHVIVIPLSLLFMALLLQEWRSPRLLARVNKAAKSNTSFVQSLRATQPSTWLYGGVLALVLGALYPTNPWDLMIYVGGFGVFLLLKMQRDGFAKSLKPYAATALMVAFFAILLYLPYWRSYESFDEGFAWAGRQTSLADGLKHWGFWLLTAGTALTGSLWHFRERVKAQQFGFFSTAAIFTALFWLLPNYRFALFVLMGIAATGWLLWQSNRQQSKVFGRREIFALFLLLLALFLLLIPEFILVRDYTCGDIHPGILLDTCEGEFQRMNTVFKLGLPAWILFGIVAGVLFSKVWYTKNAPALFRQVVLVVLTIGWLPTLAYSVYATPDRLNLKVNPSASPTLNGEEWIADFAPEDAAIVAYLKEHHPGLNPPAILEASTGAYTWSSRLGGFAGYPSLLGWGSHVYSQQGGRLAALGEPGPLEREQEIRSFYGDSKIQTAMDDAARDAFLNHYQPGFIAYGSLEHELDIDDNVRTYLQNHATYRAVLYDENNQSLLFVRR